MDQYYSNTNKIAANEKQCLFIGGLNPKVKRNELMTHFSNYGKITNLFQKIDTVTKCNKGYAFVYFQYKNSIERVQQETQIIGGRQVECKKSQGRQHNNNDLSQTIKCKIYVGNLQPNFYKEDLVYYFSVYGKIKHAYLIYESDTNVSKGFGYVHFETEESAQTAIMNENAKLNNPLMVQKFDPNFKAEKKTNCDKQKKDFYAKGKKQNDHPSIVASQNNQTINCTFVNLHLNQPNSDLKQKMDQQELILQLQRKWKQDLEMHQQNQRQSEIMQSNNFDVNCPCSNKRYSDYIEALNKQKQFDLFKKKMISLNDKNPNTTDFDTYSKCIQNLMGNENHGNSREFNPSYLEQQRNYVANAQPQECNQYAQNGLQRWNNNLQRPNNENFAQTKNLYQLQNRFLTPTTNVPFSKQNHWHKQSVSNHEDSTDNEDSTGLNFTDFNKNQACGDFYSNELQTNLLNKLIKQNVEQESRCIRDISSKSFYQNKF